VIIEVMHDLAASFHQRYLCLPSLCSPFLPSPPSLSLTLSLSFYIIVSPHHRRVDGADHVAICSSMRKRVTSSPGKVTWRVARVHANQVNARQPALRMRRFNNQRWRVDIQYRHAAVAARAILL
jgi:hypothetical protein